MRNLIYLCVAIFATVVTSCDNETRLEKYAKEQWTTRTTEIGKADGDPRVLYTNDSVVVVGGTLTSGDSVFFGCFIHNGRSRTRQYFDNFNVVQGAERRTAKNVSVREGLKLKEEVIDEWVRLLITINDQDYLDSLDRAIMKQMRDEGLLD